MLGGADITGADSSSYNAIETGIYSARITNMLGNCETVSDDIIVNAESAPTVWKSLHIISQRRHMIHLSRSLIIEGEKSILYSFMTE